MNKLCCLIIMFFTCGVSSGQNLVPNPSFEDTLNCDVAMPYIQHAYPWFNPTTSSPDYYTSIPGCGYDWTSLPINRTPRTGIAFAGIFGWDNSGQREYIETPLTDTLVAGETYNVSFYVVRSFDSYYATDNIGACLTTDSLLSSNYFNIPSMPQIYNTGIIYDTANWVLISGTFIAQGGEKYLTIGNFFNNQNCGVDSSNGNLLAGYYFVEDVSLTTVTGLNESSNNSLLNISPNPFTDKITITIKSNESLEVTLHDITSRKIFNQSFTNSASINTEQLTKGIYLYEVRNKNGVIKKGKVVKE